ncbi:uncharacterized protein LOC132302944 [Cornus florida]|uniref:uncharacterized protein LOC132302944 n=1 Tax=Cornus florida TaxID=4283 RepID=UPI0028966235|nr:uncharacterized protein LOC132302944 [Cornus florida]
MILPLVFAFVWWLVLPLLFVGGWSELVVISDGWVFLVGVALDLACIVWWADFWWAQFGQFTVGLVHVGFGQTLQVTFLLVLRLAIRLTRNHLRRSLLLRCWLFWLVMFNLGVTRLTNLLLVQFF